MCENEILYIAGENVKWFSCYENRLGVPQKAKYRITLCPSNSTWAKELKTGTQTNTGTHMFTTATFSVSER